MTSSGDSPSSRNTGIRDAAFVTASLCLLIACSVAWCYRHGYLLYYGDAQAHLNISRSIVDSRTPGYDQLGTVWLPVLHVICLPLVVNDAWWNTGLAGAIPVAICFVIAGLFFYLGAKEVYGSSAAAVVVLACFALNPNVLYLGSIPMTEIVFLAGLAVLLFALFRFRSSQDGRLIAVAVGASWWMSLTRYDGWFLIPFAGLALAVFSKTRRWLRLVVFGAVASVAPLYWIAHNWWETANALDFYNGPYSAVAIQGPHAYPGYHDWLVAAEYYGKASQLCAGWPLILLGLVGIVCAAKKAVLAPVLFLLLTPGFYIWSMHSSGGTPIHVPQLWPFSYYNSRYGIAVVVLAAFAAGAIVLVLPAAWTRWTWILVPLSVAPWLLQPSQQNWICWKESQVNSVSRRAWTRAGAQFLRSNYRSGQGILIESGTGDVSGILCYARIPLRETLYIGNGPAWYANTIRPDLVHQELWAVAQVGDVVSRAVNRGKHPPYSIADEIHVKGAPVLRINRRIEGGEGK